MMRPISLALTATLFLAGASWTDAIGAEQGTPETGANKPAGAGGDATRSRSSGPDRAANGSTGTDKAGTGADSKLDAVIGRGSGRSGDDGGALAR